MPTFNELVNGFANKQTCERIQGIVQAGLEDIHNHAVRIKALRQKPGGEGLLTLAFPKLTKLIGEIEDADRKEAATEPEHRDAPSEVNGSRYAAQERHSNSPRGSNWLATLSTSPAERSIY